MVLTDIIWTHVPAIDIFSIDTGRLHEETYEVLEKLQRRYKRKDQGRPIPMRRPSRPWWLIRV